MWRRSIYDRHSLLTNRSVSLRLVHSILALVLAVAMAVFPITMPRAAALGGMGLGGTLEASHHVHAPPAATDREHRVGHTYRKRTADAAAAPSLQADGVSSSLDSEPGCEGTTSGCCGLSTCHAFQGSSAPLFHSPHRSASALAVAGDEQADGIAPGRRERPPRSV